jgi:hypothetical protein
MKNKNGGFGNFAFWTILLVVVVFFIQSFLGNQTSVILTEVETGKPVGLLMIIPNSELPEEIRNEHPQGVQAKYMSLTGDGIKVPETGWALIEATQSQIDQRNCGNMATAAPIFRGFQPKVGSMEAGEKVYLLMIGLTGVGEGGCEVGTFVQNPSYDPAFKPFAPADSIWNLPNCLIRLWTGTKFTESDCKQSGYMPTENWIRQSPVPKETDSGMYIVYAYSLGVWVHSLETSLLPQVFSTYQLDPAIIQDINNFITAGGQ